MANIRIYALAKELGLTGSDLIAELQKQGISVKSNLSSIDEETAELVREIFPNNSHSLKKKP